MKKTNQHLMKNKEVNVNKKNETIFQFKRFFYSKTEICPVMCCTSTLAFDSATRTAIIFTLFDLLHQLLFHNSMWISKTFTVFVL